MITVNLQSGGTYSIEENIVANIKANSNGSEVVVVEAEQLRSIFSSQSPATVAALSPYFLSLTDIKGAEVEATIGYSGLVNTIDFVFNIGAGRWSKLTDNGSNSLTAIAQFVQNITVGQAITSETGYAKVSSVSYAYPSNTIYLNALRIKDVTALGFYGGSLVKYDEGGADLAEYEVGIVPATLVTQINAAGGGGSGFWTQSGGDLYPTTLTDKVGIGTATPAYKLDLIGDFSFYEASLNHVHQIYNNAVQELMYIIADDTSGANTVRSRARFGGDLLLENSDQTTSEGSQIALGTTNLLMYSTSDGTVYTGINITPALLNIVNEIGEIATFLHTGEVGIGTPIPASKLTVDSGDIEVVGSANGVILQSIDNTRWRLTVSNSGVITATAV